MSQKLIDTFQNEINKIKFPTFKQHVMELLKIAPDDILNMPSSSTGKYHPADEISKDGMIRHIKRCVIVAEETARMRGHTDEELDILIAGCILHDLFKQGIPRGKWTVKEHPIFSYEHIKKYVSNNKLTVDELSAGLLDTLAVICLYHEGSWTIPESYEKHPKSTCNKEQLQLAFSMHIIDFMASRRTIYDMMNPEYFKE